MWCVEEKTEKCWLHNVHTHPFAFLWISCVRKFQAIFNNIIVSKFNFSLIFKCGTVNKYNENWTNPHLEVDECGDPIRVFCIGYPVRSVYRITVHIFGPTPLPTIKLWQYDKDQSLPTPLVQSYHFAIDGKRKIL